MQKKRFVLLAVVCVIFVSVVLGGCTNPTKRDGYYDGRVTPESFNFSTYTHDIEYGFDNIVTYSYLTCGIEIKNKGKFAIENLTMSVKINGVETLSQKVEYDSPIKKNETATASVLFIVLGLVDTCELTSVDFGYRDYIPVTLSALWNVFAPFWLSPYFYLAPYVAIIAAYFALAVIAAWKVNDYYGSSVAFICFGWIYLCTSREARKWKNFNKTTAVLLGIFTLIGASIYIMLTLTDPASNDERVLAEQKSLANAK